MSGLETAAGAAGLLSLTIQTCSGLIKYWQAWRSFEEIQELLSRLDRLQKTLSLLQHVVDHVEPMQLHGGNHTDGLLQAVEQARQKLQEMVLRAQGSASISSVKKAQKKAAYPFSKREIGEQQAYLSSLTSDLTIGLDILKLNLSLRNTNNMEHIPSQLNTASAVAHVTHATVLSLASDINGHHVANQSKLDQVLDLLGRIAIAPSQRYDRHLSVAQHTAQRLIEHPSACRDALDLVTQIAQPPSRSVQAHSNRQLKCSCRARSIKHKPKEYNVVAIQFYTQDHSYSRHRTHCPHYLWTQKISKLGLTKFLGRTLDLVFLTSRGAGGHALGPLLQPRALQRQSSPAFDLLEDIRWDPNDDGNAGLKILAQLRELYDAGAASPVDVDSYGNNLLHIISFLPPCSRGRGLLKFGDSSEFRVLIEGLIDGGVPLNEPNKWGAHPVNVLSLAGFHENIRSTWFSTCFRGGALAALSTALGETPWGKPSTLHYNTRMIAYLRLVASELLESAQINHVQHAILVQSSGNLAILLESQSGQSVLHSRLEDTTSQGLNLLHLAYNWPEGIRILLSFGASSLVHAIDANGFNATYYACQSADPSSLRLLLEADHTRSWNNPPSGPWIHCERLLSYAMDETNSVSLHSLALVIEAIRLKRLDIVNEAKARLPALSWIGIRNSLENRLPDGDNLATLLEIFRNNAVKLPPSLSIHHDANATVYHSSPNLEQAQALWSAGFRDLDSRYSQRVGSPMFHAAEGHYTLVPWLMARNAVLIPPTNCVEQTTLGHALATSHNFRTDWTAGKTVDTFLLEHVFGSEAEDMCECACVISGCRPVNILCKLDDERPSLIELLSKGLGYHLDRETNLAFENHQVLLRHATFEALGMRHTCCLALSPRGEAEEAPYIREEDSDRKTVLESLMSEFLTQLERYSSLAEFFRNYWAPRMVRVEMRKTKVPDAETIRRLTEMGVKLETSSEYDQQDLDKFYRRLRRWIGQVWAEELLSKAISDQQNDSSPESCGKVLEEIVERIPE